MDVKASIATHRAIISTYDGCPSHSMARVTGSMNTQISAKKAVELTASESSDVEYTSIGSLQRSWFAKRKKPVSMP